MNAKAAAALDRKVKNKVAMRKYGDVKVKGGKSGQR